MFGIKVYAIWDSDKGKNGAKPRENHTLLRILGDRVSDWPCGVFANYACFENKLEDTIRNDIGDVEFTSLIEELVNQFGYVSKDDALKNPYLFAELINRSRKDGRASATLDQIIISIKALKDSCKIR